MTSGCISVWHGYCVYLLVVHSTGVNDDYMPNFVAFHVFHDCVCKQR